MAVEATSGEQTQQTGGDQTTQGQQTQQTQTPPNGQQTQQTAQSTQRPDAAQNSGQDNARERGLIADLQRERQRFKKLEQDYQTANTTLEQERRRVQALAGVTPQDPEAQELDAVRQRIVQLFPALAQLTPEKLQQVLSVGDRAASLDEVTNNHWERHGQSMLDNLATTVSDAIGAELTPRQLKSLQRAYVNECEANPEFLQRHTKGDPKLVAEFAKEFVDDWFEPARRQVVSSEASRFRRVPNGRDRTVQTTPPKAINYKDGKAVEDAMVESFRSHGGKFDN